MTQLLHLTDFHFWKIQRNPFRLMSKKFLGNANLYLKRQHRFPLDSASEFIEHLASTGIKTAFLGGDFTTTSLAEEFAMMIGWMEQLSAHDITCYAVPGNHDVYTFTDRRRKIFEEHLGEYIPGEALPSKIVLPGGTPMVFAPTARPNFVSSRGEITVAEIDAVCELIAECEAELILLGAHYPVLEETPWFRSGWERALKNAERFRSALGQVGKKVLYCSGHVHAFGYIRDADYPNLTHLSTGAFFMHRQPEPERGTFSEIHVEGGDVRVYLHVCRDAWSREEVQPRTY